ncbi:MAG: lipopolysaccharide biosynthesis protein [Bacteroidota bacterium]
MHSATEKQVVYTEVAFAEIWRSAIALISYLLRNWWIILLAGIAGGLLGIYSAWKEKPRYQSYLTFALEESSSGLGGALSLAAEFGLNLGGGKNIFEGDNIIAIFTSRHMIERVLLSPDTLNGKVSSFADTYMQLQKESNKKTVPSRLSNISFPLNQPRENFSYLQDSVLNNIYKEISKSDLIVQKPDKKLNIFLIQFTSLNERFSKVFTERLVKETTEFYTELRSKKSRETLEILENRVAQLRGSLNSAISSRSSIQDANINPAFAIAQAPLQKKQIDISAFGGAYSELYKNLELARYQYLKAIPLLQMIDEPRYPMKKIKRGKLLTGIVYAFLFSMVCILVLLIRRQFKKVTVLQGSAS